MVLKLLLSLCGCFYVALTCWGNPLVLVTYYSRDGHTAQLASAVQQGAQSISGVRIIKLPISKVTQQQLRTANAIIVGTPVYNANPAPQVMRFMLSWPFKDSAFQQKIGAVFVTAASPMAGQEATKFALMRAMMIDGLIIVGGADWYNAFGATAINKKGKTISAAKKTNTSGYALGRRVAILCKKMTATH